MVKGKGSPVPLLTVLICWWGPGIPNVKVLQMILMVLKDGNCCSLIMTPNLALLFEVLTARRKERGRTGQQQVQTGVQKLVHNFKSFGNLFKIPEFRT